MLIALYIVLFALVFIAVQAVVYRVNDTTPKEILRLYLDRLKKTKTYQNFYSRKELKLQKQGADFFISDNITLSKWYMYKLLTAVLFGLVSFVITGLFMNSKYMPVIVCGFTIFGWFLMDFTLYIQNKSSNDKMLADIMEMSRSVLYGKQGGRYISDALCDSIYVINNKRLKTAFIKFQNSIKAGVDLNTALDELEASFDNAEISSFCTVIKSLQITGQVNEAIKTLETNIAREENMVNKRRLIALENKASIYIIIIAVDIICVLMFCITEKLMAMMQIF